MKVCGQADAEEPRDLTDRIPLGATFADACRHTVQPPRMSTILRAEGLRVRGEPTCQ
jgi:hypothetical protein